MLLNIFSDKSFLPENENHVVMLYPFWGIIPEAAGDKDAGRFDEYTRTGANTVKLVENINESDIVLLPFEWRSRRQWGSRSADRVKLANDMAEMAALQDKKLLIFFNNDSREEICVKNSLVLRTSVFRSSRGVNEYALPAWSVDFLNCYRHGALDIRNKVAVPTVGYCGYVDYLHHGLRDYSSFAKRLMQGRINFPGSRLRGKAVRALIDDPRVQVDFILRDCFNGSCEVQMRQEYVDNMFGSDYALVVRGAGNFSYRLYEALSCGRIPVFIDTDCLLPYSDLIDWRSLCVWVDQGDLGDIVDRILEYHSNTTDKEFIDVQHALRMVYEQWLSPAGFFNNLWRHVIPQRNMTV